MKMKINGKDFKELNLWQKILAVIAIPALLLATFVIVVTVIGATFTGVALILAIIIAVVAVIVTVVIIIAVPVEIFRKLKRGIAKYEK